MVILMPTLQKYLKEKRDSLLAEYLDIKGKFDDESIIRKMIIMESLEIVQNIINICQERNRF